MRPADTWKDYELLDATGGNRLERWGETILIRPDPQVVWKTPRQSPLWAKADAAYIIALGRTVFCFPHDVKKIRRYDGSRKEHGKDVCAKGNRCYI